jgi:hypothetical protein
MSYEWEVAFVWRLAEYFVKDFGCTMDGGGLGEPCLCPRCSLTATFRRYANEAEKRGGLAPVSAFHCFKRRDDKDGDTCAICSLNIRNGIHPSVRGANA